MQTKPGKGCNRSKEEFTEQRTGDPQKLEPQNQEKKRESKRETETERQKESETERDLASCLANGTTWEQAQLSVTPDVSD